MADTFTDHLAAHLPLVEDYLSRHLDALASSGSEMADLSSYLYAPLSDFVRDGGKRIRPVLCLTGAEAVGAAPETALPVACALELFQAAALIHDDIADRSELRRGRPCVHIREGVGLAINAGDAALVDVTSIVAHEGDYGAELRLRLLDEIASMERNTTEGQALDLGWARDGRWDVSVADYLEMARLKTANYTAASPLALGALCAGAQEDVVEGLRAFGLDAGLAFQIQDDLLNLTGDERTQGKDFRSDVTEGKRTLVMVWALEHLDTHDREALVEILSEGTTSASRLGLAVHLADEIGAIDYARSYAHMLADRAKGHLDGLAIENGTREVLRSMADYFVERTR